MEPLPTGGTGTEWLLATETPATLASSGCFFFFLKATPLAMRFKTFRFFFLVPLVVTDSSPMLRSVVCPNLLIVVVIIVLYRGDVGQCSPLSDEVAHKIEIKVNQYYLLFITYI